MERYVSAIGFSPNIVTRPMIARGISKGDTVALIQPPQENESAEKRAEDAVDAVKSTLDGAIGNIEVDVVELSDISFDTVVTECSNVLTESPPPVVCLGAGASELHLPMTVAATAHQDHIKTTMMYGDITASSIEIDIPPLSNDLPGLARDTFISLGGMDGDEVALSELADMCDHSRSTASRHVQALADREFVSTTTKKKSKLVSLTPLGAMKHKSMQHD